jgi:hypothetical protein
MIAPPTSTNAALDSLHSAGWSIGETATAAGWIVTAATTRLMRQAELNRQRGRRL